MKSHKGNEPQSTPAEQMRTELKRVRYKREYARTLRSTLVALLAAVLVILCAAAYLPVIRITGDSMANTLRQGDILITLRGDEVQPGDLAVFYVEGSKMLVKRVVATGGDQVTIAQDGTVTVNDQVLSEPYVQEKALGECDLAFPYEVPQERVFVMGDHRGISIDSRSSAMGCIAREQIIGKAALRIWPLSDFGLLDREWTE